MNDRELDMSVPRMFEMLPPSPGAMGVPHNADPNMPPMQGMMAHHRGVPMAMGHMSDR